MKQYNRGAAVFVKVEDYKEIVGVVGQLRAKVKEVRASIDKVEHLRDKENEALEHWKSTIDEVEDKIGNISDDMLEPEDH